MLHVFYFMFNFLMYLLSRKADVTSYLQITALHAKLHIHTVIIYIFIHLPNNILMVTIEYIRIYQLELIK